MMNFFKQTIMAVLIVTLGTIPLLAQQKPGQVVVDVFNKGIMILQDPVLRSEGKAKERREMLWNVLGPFFSFEEIAKRALGQHWKAQSENERKEFVDVFTDILKETYLIQSDSYSGENMVFLQEEVRGNRSKVQTNLITADKKKVVVDFTLIQSKEGWKIYDVTIEGVSLVGNYRTQFNSILAKSSFRELLNQLQEKRNEMIESNA